MKLFGRWKTDIEVKDLGLKNYINLDAKLAPRSSHGRHASKKFTKSKVNLVERLMNHLFCPGHSGKKHKLSSGRCAGSSQTTWKIVKKAFELLEEKEKENPVKMFVRAVENAAIREEITSYKSGSLTIRKGVITSPQRRVDWALRLFAQAAYQKSHGSTKSAAECLAEEIRLAWKSSKESRAISEKERLEREAEGSR